jgi:hypothetical protein
LLAVKNGRAEAVQLLLDAGAGIYIKNKVSYLVHVLGWNLCDHLLYPCLIFLQKGKSAHSLASSKEMKSLLSCGTSLLVYH